MNAMVVELCVNVQPGFGQNANVCVCVFVCVCVCVVMCVCVCVCVCECVANTSLACKGANPSTTGG
jgi:hypothetical protein